MHGFLKVYSVKYFNIVWLINNFTVFIFNSFIDCISMFIFHRLFILI